MNVQKNFTTGLLMGICSVLIVLIISGATLSETPSTAPIYEFYDLKDTRAIIFNRVTGEIEYKEIRTEAINESVSYDLYLHTPGFLDIKQH